MEEENELISINNPFPNIKNSRTEEQKKSDRELIKGLYIKRHKLADMQKHPMLQHISKTQVRNDLQIVLKQMKSSPLFDKKFRATKQLESMDDLYREAMEAWEKSKKTKTKTFSKTKEGDQFASTENGTMEEDSYGDPNLLKVALNILAEQNKVLGLQQMTKTTEVNLNNNNSQVIIGMQIT